MEYQCNLHQIDRLDDYQGWLRISIKNHVMMTYYQVLSYEFTQKYLLENKTFLVDLWVVLGKLSPNLQKKRTIHFSTSTSNAEIAGKIIKILNKHEYRVDCGDFLIDVSNDIYESNTIFSVGDYIKVIGDYQVFFPNTENSKDKIWLP